MGELMLKLTQTVTASKENGFVGNCWQTCVACVLDLDPETLPDQSKYDWRREMPDGTIERGPAYGSALRAYLRKHHDLAYLELHHPQEVYPLLRVAEPGWHFMTGRTIRSDAFGGLRHVVVGRYGKMVWDPHPSRAGLTSEIQWAFLVPFPREWEDWERRRNPEPCTCPACKVSP